MRVRTGLPIAAAVALSVALTACSSSTPKPVPSTAPTSPATPTTPTTGAGTAGSSPASTTVPTIAPTRGALAAINLGLSSVVTGLSSPVAIVFRPGAVGTPGTMYVVEQPGKLRIVDGSAKPATALDISTNLTHGNEQGFLGATFSPDGTHLYVDYTDRHGDTNVDEYV